MSIRVFLAATLLVALAVPAHADFSWPAKGKKAAIVLTYDDSLRSQLDIAIPQLDAAGFKGTFFLDGDLTPADTLRWRDAQRSGHELGNHSAFHPCPRAILPDRTQYYTENYDVGRMLSEIGIMNLVLFGIDGRMTRTYAYPCSQSLAGGVDYAEALRNSTLVKYARTGGDAHKSVVSDFTQLNGFQVPSWGFLDHPDGKQLIAYVERVRTVGGLGVLQFHGVGGDYLEVSAQARQQLLDWLRNHPDVWVATFQEVMDYVGTRTR